MELPNVLQFVVLDYLCPLETPNAIRSLINPFENDLMKWTISRQRKKTVINEDICVTYGNVTNKLINLEYIVMIGEQIHCVDGPAIVTKHEQFWVSHGQVHKSDGPAFAHESGLRIWCNKGIPGQMYKIMQRSIDEMNYDNADLQKWYFHCYFRPPIQPLRVLVTIW